MSTASTSTQITVPLMTVEMFQSALPKNQRGRVTQEVMDIINDALQDEFTRDQFADNFIGFTSVLSEGKWKMTDYVNAVKYVSYKVMGDTNIQAYAKTFPHRFQQFLAQGKSAKDQSAYVAMYHKSKLVQLITAQSIIPTHILNAHVFQEAINVQRDIMNDQDVSPKVRSDAANSLMTHLKAPEAKKVEVELGVKDSGELSELRKAMGQMAQMQFEKIVNGEVTPKDVAHFDLIEKKEPIEDADID